MPDLHLIANFSIALLAIANPVGKVPLWLKACQGLNFGLCLRLAFLITLTGFIVLCLCLVGGRFFLSVFQIDIPAFRIGGGIILLVTALQMLEGSIVKVHTQEDEKMPGLQKVHTRFREVVFPLAIPFIAGPGTITTVVLYGIRAQGVADYLAMATVVAGILLMVFGTFLASPKIRDMVGPTVLEIQTRIFGIILAAIAAQLMLEGLSEAFPQLVENGTALHQPQNEVGNSS